MTASVYNPQRRSSVMRPWTPNIDPATIPDAVLYRELARRRGDRGALMNAFPGFKAIEIYICDECGAGNHPPPRPLRAPPRCRGIAVGDGRFTAARTDPASSSNVFIVAASLLAI